MKSKSKKEIEFGINPTLKIDTNSIFDVSYEIDDDKIVLSFDKLTTKINRDFFIDNFEILTEPHTHQSEKTNYYPIDKLMYITEFGNIYIVSSKYLEILEKEKEDAVINEEYELAGNLKEKISKIESRMNEWYYLGKDGERVYAETLYKVK